jgi:SAM-dependent methyltransferase
MPADPEPALKTTDTLQSLFESLNRDVPGVIEQVSPLERAHNVNEGRPADLAGYLSTAQWCLKRMRLSLLAAQKTEVRRVLDLPCGFGRMLRTIKAEFPDAELTACDIDPNAVDYCAETFGATPVYSSTNIDALEIEGPFDLIWCASLFTHLDRAGWVAFLKLFESLLSPGGVLIFTVHGRFVAEQLFRPRFDLYGLTEEEVTEILRDYDETGFGYSDYPAPEEWLASISLPRNYGISLSSSAWVCELLAKEAPTLDLLTFMAGGAGRRWGPNRPANGLNLQDMVSCIGMDPTATIAPPPPPTD